MEGFLQNDLDIKVLILYIGAHLVAPVPRESLIELALCDGGIDYFSFSQCLSDLIQSSHMEETKGGLYVITDKGKKNSEICEGELPYSLRSKLNKAILQENQVLKRREMVQALAEKADGAAYLVTLKLNDDYGHLMTLQIHVAQEEMANAITSNFESNAEMLYSKMMEILLKREPGE